MLRHSKIWTFEWTTYSWATIAENFFLLANLYFSKIKWLKYRNLNYLSHFTHVLCLTSYDNFLYHERNVSLRSYLLIQVWRTWIEILENQRGVWHKKILSDYVAVLSVYDLSLEYNTSLQQTLINHFSEKIQIVFKYERSVHTAVPRKHRRWGRCP